MAVKQLERREVDLVLVALNWVKQSPLNLHDCTIPDVQREVLLPYNCQAHTTI